MLKQLRIINLILVESAEIDFSEGFNVLSGETGSGKSAIMNALSLITGERAETGMIRKGAEKGIVEAIFDKAGIPAIEPLLEQAGIDFEETDELYIRREISAAGKSRAFINNQLAQLSLLRAIGHHLVHMVGQHANQDLLSLDRHRAIVDIFGGFKEQVSAFSSSLETEIDLQNELTELIENEAQRLREIEVCQMVMEELEEVNLKEGEDEELFQEYSLLVHAEEIGIKMQDICETLNGEKGSILPSLHRQKIMIESLVSIDPSLAETSQAFQNALIELQEITNTLNIYRSRVEYNPNRLEEVNGRLTAISRLKKKYGSTFEEIHRFGEENKRKFNELQNADHKIEELKEKLQKMKKTNDRLASELTALRKDAAHDLAIALKNELCSLNMPKVDFQIDVIPQKRTKTGDDRIEFFLLPNVGEHRIPIKDCASGGELSRVQLSLQTLLSGKERIPSLVFDEIDANIGGETAKVVGEKLKAIGQEQQVLCITHFPQVAKYADHHLQIAKKVVGDRTLTFIHALDENMRELELARMSGDTM